jgi:hypothetical protein
MQIFNSEAFLDCIQDVVRKEIRQALRDSKQDSHPKEDNDRLLTKKEMAEELNVSLVTLTEWMKQGLPFLRLNKRVYFKRDEVINTMTHNRLKK